MEQEHSSTAIPADEMRFGITPEEAFAYFNSVAPNGVTCNVCGGNGWGVNAVGGKNEKGEDITAVFPEGIIDSFDLQIAGSDKNKNLLRNSSRSYAFSCNKCGYQLRFLAGLVAGMAAIKRRSA